MNINENNENQDLQRYNLLPFEGLGWDIYKMYLARLEQMPMGASLVKGSLYCTFVSCNITECSPHVSWLLIDLESRNRYQMIALTMLDNHVIRHKYQTDFLVFDYL